MVDHVFGGGCPCLYVFVSRVCILKGEGIWWSAGEGSDAMKKK